MFDRPHQALTYDLISSPAEAATLINALQPLGAGIDTERPDAIRQLANFALNHWLTPSNEQEAALASIPYEQVSALPTLEELGLIDEVAPARQEYDHILIDGGTLPVCRYRLSFFDRLRDQGLQSDNVVMFAGQRQRLPQDGDVEAFAEQLRTAAAPWFRDWIDMELAKTRETENPWERSFATEHEIAILALLGQFGNSLEHVGTRTHTAPTSVDPQTPPVTIRAELFRLGTTQITVLNAPAVIRVIFGTPLPPEESRPTGESCFYEWAALVNPNQGATILSLTHNPNIYRTWLDLQKAAIKIGRSDLVIEGCGAAIEPGRPYGYILRSLARIAFGLCGLQDLLQERAS